MKRHIFLLPLLLSLAAGCSSMRSMLAFQDSAPGAQEAAVPVAAPQAAQPEPMAQWCQRVAANARNRASASGFDGATQDRIAAQEYRQCLAMGAAG
jgi:hypothetical protein